MNTKQNWSELADAIRNIHNDIRDQCSSAVYHDIAIFHTSQDILDMLTKRLMTIEDLSAQADELVASAIQRGSSE